MTIAVHLGSAFAEKHPYTRSFIELAKNYLSHHFIFIYDGNRQPGGNLPANCTPVFLAPEIKNSLVKYYWYNYKLPAILTRYNADYLFTSENTSSLRTTVPQCMLYQNPGGKIRAYTEKFFLKSAGVAEKIAFPDPLQKATLERRYRNVSEKFVVAPYGIPAEFKDAGFDKNEAIKEKYTHGNDYFLATITANNSADAVKLLKAYSIFKKWQKSSVMLLILLKELKTGNPIPDFHLYKHKNDVVLVKYPSCEEEASLFSAAYACLDIFIAESGVSNALQAMKSGAPVITSAGQDASLVYGDAALYAPGGESGLAEKIMLIYKDEGLRKQCISKGFSIAAGYSTERSAIILSGIAGLPLQQTS